MAFDIANAIVVLVGGNPILVVFLVSIIGNMIPFFPVPYLLFVITIASGFPGLGVFQIAAVSALGASIGKFVSYGLGYGARRAGRKQGKVRLFQRNRGWQLLSARARFRGLSLS